MDASRPHRGSLSRALLCLLLWIWQSLRAGFCLLPVTCLCSCQQHPGQEEEFWQVTSSRSSVWVCKCLREDPCSSSSTYPALCDKCTSEAALLSCHFWALGCEQAECWAGTGVPGSDHSCTTHQGVPAPLPSSPTYSMQLEWELCWAQLLVGSSGSQHLRAAQQRCPQCEAVGHLWALLAFAVALVCVVATGAASSL